MCRDQVRAITVDPKDRSLFERSPLDTAQRQTKELVLKGILSKDPTNII